MRHPRPARRRLGLSLAAWLTVSLAACGGEDPASDEVDTESTAAAAEGLCATTDVGAEDLLGRICEAGELRVATEAAYPPQSSLNEQTGEYEGFDIDVATEFAERLGVEIAWETPSWDVITAGSWNDRWDLSVGSMTPTNDRQQVLEFTQPYYYTPAVVVVHTDNDSISDVSTDVDGAKVGVCSSCTYEQFLDKSLAIEGFEFDFVIDEAEISGYDTDTTALQDLAIGDGARLDAVITSLTTAQGYIDAGNPVKIVGDPVFYEPLSAAIDKSAGADPAAFVAAVDGIVGEMHDDGTLTSLSEKWYDGVDLTIQQ